MVSLIYCKVQNKIGEDKRVEKAQNKYAGTVNVRGSAHCARSHSLPKIQHLWGYWRVPNNCPLSIAPYVPLQWQDGVLMLAEAEAEFCDDKLLVVDTLGSLVV